MEESVTLLLYCRKWSVLVLTYILYVYKIAFWTRWDYSKFPPFIKYTSTLLVQITKAEGVQEVNSPKAESQLKVYHKPVLSSSKSKWLVLVNMQPNKEKKLFFDSLITKTNKYVVLYSLDKRDNIIQFYIKLIIVLFFKNKFGSISLLIDRFRKKTPNK